MTGNAEQKEYNTDESRGIQNQQVRDGTSERFNERLEGRSTQAHLRTPVQRKQGGRESNNSYSERPNRTSRKRRSPAEESLILNNLLTEASREAGITYEADEAKLLIKNPPTAPDFPGMIFGIAILKDGLDLLDLTGIGIILTTALSFLMAIILFIWFLEKMSGGWWKKKMVGYLWKRYALAIVLETLPFFKIIPATTILVLMAHNREKKVVQLFNGALERLRGSVLR